MYDIDCFVLSEKNQTNKNVGREVVVAQLVEWSLPIPEIRGSNPVIGKKLFISNICLLSTVY